jgi:hypothetical protein
MMEPGFQLREQSVVDAADFPWAFNLNVFGHPTSSSAVA